MSSDYAMPSVNRMALVVEAGQGYLEWARGCFEGDEGLTMEEVAAEPTVYLIPEINGEPERWLRRNYGVIFEHELFAWCTDESRWPADRSFKVFQRFFRVRLGSVVLDMGEGAIEREGDQG